MEQHYYHHKNPGFSLLELMLVLLIAAVITLLGVSQYQNWQRQKDLAVLKTNVALLLDSVNHYYRQNCQNQTIASCNANRDQLKTAGFWPKLLKNTRLIIATSADTNYDVGVESIANPTSDFCGLDNNKVFHPCRLYVTANLDFTAPAPLNTIGWYKHILNANSFLGVATLKWVTLPSYSIPEIDTHLWILKSNLEYFKTQQEKSN